MRKGVYIYGASGVWNSPEYKQINHRKAN